MKTRLPLILLAISPLLTAQGQGTAFTYQGRLNDGAGPANGVYDLQFAIFDSTSAGSLIAGPLTNSATGVTNGLFTVTLDFGANPFNGAARWLDIAVRTNGSGAFTSLTPRQQITPTPYAITASNLTGTVSTTGLSGNYANAVTISNAADGFSGTFSGNGANVTNVNAAALNGLTTTNLWQLGGNNVSSAQFLGSTNSQSLEFKVGGLRALRLEPNAFNHPNVIGGSPSNRVDAGVIGAFIGGGGFDALNTSPNRIGSGFGVIAGGDGNIIDTNADSCVIGGGDENHILTRSGQSVIAGGELQIVTNASLSFLGGGFANQIGDTFSEGGVIDVPAPNTANVIAGGGGNAILFGSQEGTIGGGGNNFISNSIFATIPGGRLNSAVADYTFAAGRRAKANHVGAFVWADSTDADFASTGTNQFIIRAGGGVGIGTAAPATALHVRDIGDCQISVESIQSGERWTLQSSGTNTPGKFGTFQIIDRTAGASRLLIDTNGNVGIGATPTNKLQVGGGITCTALTQTSDRNAKENFEPVSPREVLNKVAALPITTWNFKELRDGRHMGPMAQDFYAAFRLGGSDKTITSVDPDGVALAAIQGLNQKLEDTLQNAGDRSHKSEDRIQNSESRIQNLENENAELKKRLAALERLLLPKAQD
jgi:hypothetical protein